jgi:peptide/nickel transport system substrate-binding protein
MKKAISKVNWSVFVLLIITSLVLISSSVDTATAAETPKYGGTLVLRHNMPTSMGYPARSAAMNAIGDIDHNPICVDPLLRFGKDGRMEPWLATSWKYSGDMKSLTLTLRKGVKFHDGTDFNAAAVKTNLDLCRAAKTGQLASVSSVDVVDNFTVKLNLSSVDAYLLTNFGEWVGLMVSPAALAKGEDYCRTNPVGTGPFKQVEFISGVSVKFKKWEGYWQKGKPYLDAVEIVNIPDDTTAIMAFKKGDVGMMQTRDAIMIKGLNANVSFVGTYLTLVPDSAHENSPFSDLKVRQAVAHAIDSKTLQKSFGADVEVSNQLVEKSSVHYNPDIKGYPYDVEKAKKLLEASKYPKGFKGELIYSATYNVPTIVAAIQAMLTKINVQLDLKPVGSAQYIALRTSGWQNGLLVTSAGTDASTDSGRLLSTKFSKFAPEYSVVARSAEYDALLDKILLEPDLVKRVALTKQFMKQQVDGECMVLYPYNFGWNYVKQPYLKGSSRGDGWFHQWTPENAWFDK